MATSFYCKGDNKYHYKSELPKTLQPYYDYPFPSCGETDKRFLVFDARYKLAVEKLLPEGYTFYSWNTGHYETSAVIKTPDDKFIFFKYSDVRFFPNEWCTNILIRTMAHDKDWTGGMNRYTTLFNLAESIKRLYR